MMRKNNGMKQRCTHGVDRDRMAALFVRCLLVHAKRHHVRFPLLVLENKDFNPSLFFFSTNDLPLIFAVESVS